MNDESAVAWMGQVIQIDECPVRDYLGGMVRGTMREMWNALVDAKAVRRCGAGRHERRERRQDRHSDS